MARSAFEPAGTASRSDLILAINGTSLDDPTQALAGAADPVLVRQRLTVTVSRNGTPQEVNLNLANVSLDDQRKLRAPRPTVGCRPPPHYPAARAFDAGRWACRRQICVYR